jgi:hypothetical protein
MRTMKVLSAGITGTSAMTLYSYILSIVKSRDFREPQILSQLLRRLQPAVSKKVADIACWNVHYTVGVFFAAVYDELWKQGKLKPNLKNALMLGVLSGGFAIAVWHSVFNLHPDPPQKEFRRYYWQLFTAHVIFGAFAYLGYRLAEESGNKYSASPVTF